MVTEETRNRVGSYLRGQAAKLSVPEIGAKVGAAYDDLASAVAGLTPDQTAFKPSADDWSVAEILAHLSASTARSFEVIASLARGETPVLPDWSSFVDTQPLPPVELVERARRGLETLLRQLPPEPASAPKADHMYFGPLSCKEWLLFLRVHTLDHVQQAQAIKTNPAFPGTAPVG